MGRSCALRQAGSAAWVSDTRPRFPSPPSNARFVCDSRHNPLSPATSSFSAPVKRRPRVLFVDQPHEPQILFVLAHRLVIQTRAVQTQQFTLSPNAEI